MESLPEYVDGLPNICGAEEHVAALVGKKQPVFLPDSRIEFGRIKSAFACALHMHQPLIPAGGHELKTAALISNLQYMMDNQHLGDNHNAPAFVWAYKRIGEFIPQLVGEGKQPRIMLEYSGTLLHGLRQMGCHDVIASLQHITGHPEHRRCVEWLGMPWGHAVAPSTPSQDFRLHVVAFQQHFAAIFGNAALERVKGFSPSEMALPNHPDVAFEFVRTLKSCGYRWVLVQEHTIERPDGTGPEQRHLPHRLVCKNSKGEEESIIAIIKTQGSDTKLVAQMQPYYEAKSVGRATLGGKSVPQLVTQIADGENGGVMMNEFPQRFFDAIRESSGSDTPAMNVTEYLEHLEAIGVRESDLPVVQPIHQHRLWERMGKKATPEALAKAIEDLKAEDSRFSMEGGSWTNHISWVKGYENVLGPIDKASALFAQKALGRVASTDRRYRNALFHLLCAQTSCYRYWGQGLWTDYGREITRRATDILVYDF